AGGCDGPPDAADALALGVARRAVAGEPVHRPAGDRHLAGERVVAADQAADQGLVDALDPQVAAVDDGRPLREAVVLAVAVRRLGGVLVVAVQRVPAAVDHHRAELADVLYLQRERSLDAGSRLLAGRCGHSGRVAGRA